MANRSEAENKAKGCEGGFFSAKRQRVEPYEGDDSPRIWTGEAARRGPVIDTSVVNRPPGGRAAWPPGLGPEHSPPARPPDDAGSDGDVQLTLL